jgi:hypothetical protein
MTVCEGDVSRRANCYMSVVISPRLPQMLRRAPVSSSQVTAWRDTAPPPPPPPHKLGAVFLPFSVLAQEPRDRHLSHVLDASLAESMARPDLSLFLHLKHIHYNYSLLIIINQSLHHTQQYYSRSLVVYYIPKWDFRFSGRWVWRQPCCGMLHCLVSLTCWCLRALKMEAVSTSEVSVGFYETARCSGPEASHVHGMCLFMGHFVTQQ